MLSSSKSESRCAGVAGAAATAASEATAAVDPAGLADATLGEIVVASAPPAPASAPRTVHALLAVTSSVNTPSGRSPGGRPEKARGGAGAPRNGGRGGEPNERAECGAGGGLAEGTADCTLK